MSPVRLPAACARPLRIGVVVLATVLLCGCGTRDPEDVPTAEEQVLMVRLTRDPFVVIESWTRNDDGFLVVTTSQGSATSRYIFKPEHPGDKALNIHHLEDASRLETGEDGQRGTGPRANHSGRSR